MSDEAAFLEAIRSEPGDALARLAFADWLEEHGDPRGEWVRARTQLSLLPPDDPAFGPLKAREAELAPAALAGWLATDAPVWCLLGGGLPFPPLPDWLVERNEQSWRDMIGFFGRFTQARWNEYLRPMEDLVAHLAGTELARLFRAGQSMTTFVVSTAARHGLWPDDAFVDLTAGSQVPRFTMNYDAPGRRGRESATCDLADLRRHFARFLARLWCDTRGRISPPGV